MVLSTEAPASPLKKAFKAVTADVTPTRLWFLLVNICVLSVLFFLATASTVQQHMHAVRTIGFDAAPSVIAAHWIKIGVERMDTDLVNELLCPPSSKEAEDLLDDFEQTRLNLSKQLVAAAKNITYAGEQEAMEGLQSALGQYEMQAQATLDLHNSGKNAQAIQQYRIAFKTLQDNLLKSTDSLDNANSIQLDDTYAREKGVSAMSRGLVTVIGMILILVLLYSQFYLFKRFRRVFNMPLLLSMICATIVLQHLSSALSSSSIDLKVAKEDSYDSVVALLDARSDSYDANASESRWFLDRENAAEHDKNYQARADSIMRTSQMGGFDEIIEDAEKQRALGEKFNLIGFEGSLANELNNSTFAGESRAALDAIKAFADYLEADKRIRELDKSGNHAEALKLALSFSSKSSNYHFNKYDDAIQRALDINEDHLHSAVDDAVQRLHHLTLISVLMTLLVVICAYAGLSPRLEEYQKVAYMHKRS